MPVHSQIYGERLHYAYPINNVVSFTYIAKKHIEQLSRYASIRELDVDFLNPNMIPDHATLAIHPLLYPFFKGDAPGLQTFEAVASKADKLIAFDTADSDRLSPEAIRLVNMTDLLIVPSTFAKTAYQESGATTKIEIVPHGISREFLYPAKSVTSPTLQSLERTKLEKNLIYVLFDIRHSGFRKGADLVFAAMKRVQQKLPHVILLIKRLPGIDPYLQLLKSLNHVEVSKELPEREYRELFDIADIAVFPSRGGGFELQALEAISRGIPTLVPKAGCFLDYIQYAIPIEVSGKVKVLEGNPIHIGMGWEASIDDLTLKLLEVIDHLEEFKREAEKKAEKVRKLYNWSRIGELLEGVLRQHAILKEMPKPGMRLRQKAVHRT